MNRANLLISPIFLLAGTLTPLSAPAQTARAATVKENRAFIYQGRLVRPDGSGPEGTLPVTLKIYSPDPSLCLLWQETQNVTFVGGSFSVELGHAAHRTAGPAGGAASDFKQVFVNNPSLTISSAQCAVGNSFTPQTADDRLLSASFNDQGTVIDLTGLPIKSVPYALQAEEIGGYGLANLLKISGAGSSVTFAPNEVQSLKDLLGGDLNWDMKTRKITNLADPTAATDAATRGWVISQINAAGGGTISSLGFAAPSIFTITGAPLTANGTISMGLTAQAAGSVFAGPASGGPAAPGFRPLDPLDVPALDAAKITTGVFSAARIPAGLAPGGSAGGDLSGTYPGPNVAKLQGNAVSSTTLMAGDAGKAYVWSGANLTAKYFGMADLKNAAGTSYYPQCGPSQTLNWVSATDTLTCASIAISDAAVTYASQAQNKVFASPNGSSGAPTYRALAAQDIPGLDWSKITSGKPTTLSGYGISDSLIVNGGQAGPVSLGSSDASAVTVKTNNAAALTVLPNGNIGVGTAAPFSQLHLHKTVGFDAPAGEVLLTRYSGTSNDMRGAGLFNYFDSTAGKEVLAFGLAQSSTPNTIANTKMVIRNDGNLGVGTTSPSTPVHVYSSTSKLTLESTATGASGILLKNAAGSLDLSMNSVRDFAFTDVTGGPSRFLIRSNGNFGIGDYYGAANYPQNKLSVNGSASIGFPTNADIAAPANGLLVNGNVGIGTSTPASKLDVAGDINTTGKYAINGAGVLAAYGTYNVALGQATMASASGGYNTALGSIALNALGSGTLNVAVGLEAARSLTTQSYNTAIGGQTQRKMVGSSNVSVGYFAMYGNSDGVSSTGTGNVAVGNAALSSVTSGSGNAVLGTSAGADVTTGSNNIFVGNYPTTGVNVSTGSNNIMVGYDVRPASPTASNQLNIGNLVYGTGLSSGATASGGNIGIGTSSPSMKLDVQGVFGVDTTKNVTRVTQHFYEFSGQISGPGNWPACTDVAKIITLGTISGGSSFADYSSIEVEIFGTHTGYNSTSYLEYKKFLIMVGSYMSSVLLDSAGSTSRVNLWNGSVAGLYENVSLATPFTIQLKVDPNCGSNFGYYYRVRYSSPQFVPSPTRAW